ncbi:MAG: GNAT family N-acetyltransferase [Pyrinomonadaceae bacterium]|nr:GNAT family N-acetyltransferase [Pyrinomonadaceae bacterium]
MNDELQITMRPVTPGDLEFLLEVYASSREAELAMLPWDAAMKRTFVEHQYGAQTAHYLEAYPSATHDIISTGGAACGRLYVVRGENEIAILDINVLPEFRRRGIATRIIEGLKAEARGRSIRVYVETFNPSQKLFAELGFKPDAAEPDAMHILFRWQEDGGGQ